MISWCWRTGVLRRRAGDHSGRQVDDLSQDGTRCRGPCGASTVLSITLPIAVVFAHTLPVVVLFSCRLGNGDGVSQNLVNFVALDNDDGVHRSRQCILASTLPILVVWHYS